jgi:hypothetical protein
MKCIFGAIYIPPEGSTYSNIDIVDRIEGYIIDFQTRTFSVCMLIARTGTLSDFADIDRYISDCLFDCETKELLNRNNRDTLGFPTERFFEVMLAADLLIFVSLQMFI